MATDSLCRTHSTRQMSARYDNKLKCFQVITAHLEGYHQGDLTSRRAAVSSTVRAMDGSSASHPGRPTSSEAL
jgi:hypothetical protein